MSASLLSSPILREVHRSPATHLRSIMATCVDNPQPKPTMNHLCMNPTRSKIEESLYRYVGLSRPGLQDLVFSPPASPSGDETWGKIREEAREDAEMEPVLRKYYEDSILSHGSLESALARHLAAKLGSEIGSDVMEKVFKEVLESAPEVGRAVRADLKAARDRDPACTSMARCLLYYKGFQACQAHRIAHRLWMKGRVAMALFIQSRVSEVFAVDIHPAARIGEGVLLDHATGVVIGETAVVGENVSILHNVTLGGTGKVGGDRHPKIGDGVLVGAGTQILGNVRIGDGAKIGAGSVVLKEVPERATAVGNPARVVGGKAKKDKEEMPGISMDHSSWSDYVI
ncbi:serine O-acetyltransferase protein [Dioscorea alata]|uniref:Serine O-acetyltransferase protein n=1 Tax=Dioscorea alata TaxID=55571 RepID=A0ACB7UX52_DIOAL|nr:serine O-acetyltransferase protein [Dioscorea alata]